MILNFLGGVDEDDLYDYDDEIDSIELQHLFERYYKDLLNAFSEVMKDKSYDRYIISDIIKRIGDTKDEETHQRRFDLLNEAIRSEFPIYRTAACVGISLLGDARFIPIIEEVLQEERVPIAQSMMISLLEYMNKYFEKETE